VGRRVGRHFCALAWSSVICLLGTWQKEKWRPCDCWVLAGSATSALPDQAVTNFRKVSSRTDYNAPSYIWAEYFAAYVARILFLC
jgi:hypothetical protein